MSLLEAPRVPIWPIWAHRRTVVSGIDLGWSTPSEPRWPAVERLFIDPPLYKKPIHYNMIDENLGINQGKYLAFAMILTRQRPKAGVS